MGRHTACGARGLGKTVMHVCGVLGPVSYPPPPAGIQLVVVISSRVIISQLPYRSRPRHQSDTMILEEK